MLNISFYELLIDQLNDNETERWFVILVLKLNTISWAKVENALSQLVWFFRKFKVHNESLIN